MRCKTRSSFFTFMPLARWSQFTIQLMYQGSIFNSKSSKTQNKTLSIGFNFNNNLILINKSFVVL